jgi:hypothetical protein
MFVIIEKFYVHPVELNCSYGKETKMSNSHPHVSPDIMLIPSSVSFSYPSRNLTVLFNRDGDNDSHVTFLTTGTRVLRRVT